MANFGGFKHFGRALGFLAALVIVVGAGGFYLSKKLAPSHPAPQSERAPGAELKPPARFQGGAREGARRARRRILESQTVELAARPALTLKGEAPLDDAQKSIAEAVGKLNAAAAKAGVKASGKPIAVFSETSEKSIRFEAMLPLEKAPDGKGKLEGGVEVGATPAGKALKFEHRGPYEDIELTYEAITAFLDEKGLDTKDRFIEEYISDVADAEDEEGEVDIYIFVK